MRRPPPAFRPRVTRRWGVPLGVALVLLLGACGGGEAGLPCERTRDCPSGQTCWTRVSEQIAFADGFCTRTCEAPGQTSGCPAGSICAISAERSLCAPTCDATADAASTCGEGLTCGASDEAAGPTACVLRP